jgi:hypothetical protein
MKRLFGASVVLGIFVTIVAYNAEPGQTAQVSSPAAVATPVKASTAVSDADLNGVIKQYCSGCHSETGKSGNLSLVGVDVAASPQHAEVAEKMIRKLRAGMMPPPGARRPDADTQLSLVTRLENALDTAAARNPNPGGRTFQRLNRPEYQRAIKDLLDLDVDAGSWLPLDTMSNNFDNMADAQTLSPTLLESYLNAAAAISRMSVGDRNAPSVDETFTTSQYLSQHPWDHIDGAPYGTRGGIVINHVFPADADYVFGMTFHGGFGVSPGDNTRLEDIDISIDGERVALIPFNAAGGKDDLKTMPIFIRAGQHKVAAAFVRRLEGPYEDLMRPHDWSFAGGGSGGQGVSAIPHLRDLVITGPKNATGVSETSSRKKIFTCRPTSPSEERPCAREIVTRLGGEAYRRTLSPADVDSMLAFYDAGAKKGGFELGIRSAIEQILSSPYFVLRLERAPADARPGQIYRIADIDMASRLSFFLWGTPPDDQLEAVAAQGKLSAPGELEKQTRRMLADPRAEALGTRFAYQWFRLQDLYKNHPDPNFYPNFDENLAHAMQRETELFFYNLVRENRSLLELFNANYTYANDLLARHYGIPGVAGPEFRRVNYPDSNRRGLLGQGSVLVLTSLANRTSPVLRGKWVMEVLLGTPPPPPPPNVPDLDQTAGAQGGKMLTTRQRMEMHRANPACASCHKMMDPIGLALDNFDVTAKWRNRENGMPLDTHGQFYDGSDISSPADLANILMKRPIPLVRTFTENLMAYALGRRVEYFDEPTVRAIAREAEGDNYRMASFILGVVKSDAFQMKRMEPATESKAAGGQ